MFEQTDKYDSQFTINEGEGGNFVKTKNEVLGLNQKAMEYMNQGNFKLWYTLLTKAESIISNWSHDFDKETPQASGIDEAQGSNFQASVYSEADSNEKIKLMSITYNNLACYYMKNNKIQSTSTNHTNRGQSLNKHQDKNNTPKKALDYLNKALKIEEKGVSTCKQEKINTNVDQIIEWTEHAGTFLNACAIYSQMEKHKEALMMSKKAINVLNSIQADVQKQEESSNISSKAEIKIQNENKPVSETISTNDAGKKSYLKGYYLMMAVAYYNKGVEYEYLNDLNEAISSINEALTIAKLHLGKQHYLTSKIQESKSKINEKKRKVNSRIKSLRTPAYVSNNRVSKNKHL